MVWRSYRNLARQVILYRGVVGAAACLLTAVVAVSLPAALAQPIAESADTATVRERVAAALPGDNVLLGRLHFKENQSILSGGNRAAVNDIVAAVKAAAPDDYSISVKGFTDASGGAVENRELSRKRAGNVAEAIAAGLSLAPDRLSVDGLGESGFLERFSRFDPRQRRVEVVLEVAGTPPTVEIATLAWDDTDSTPPDIETIELVTDGKPVVLPIPPDRRVLNGFGTIELWMSPQWKGGTTDAVMFELTDGEAVAFSVRLSGDRQALYLWNSAEAEAIGVRHDFTENRPYHLALVTAAGRTSLMVDGEMLPQPVPVGYGPADARYLVIGNLETGGEPFYGKLARLRVWDHPLMPEDVRGQMRTDRPPPLESNLYGRLQLYTEMQEGLPALKEGVRQFRPTDTWWHHYGSDYVRVHNKVDFATGEAAACTSSNLVALQHAAGNNRNSCATDQLDPSAASDVVQHSIYPVYSLEWLPAPEPRPQPLFGVSRGALFDYAVPDGAAVDRVRYTFSLIKVANTDGTETELRRLEGIQLEVERDGETELIGPPIGGAPTSRKDYFSLIFDDVITGYEAVADDKGIVGIRIHSDSGRTSRWLGGDPEKYAAAGRKIERSGLRGIAGGGRFIGFRGRMILEEGRLLEGGAFVDAMYGAEVTALDFLESDETTRPGVIVRSEFGTETRFARTGPNTYRSMAATTPLSTCDGSRCANPELTFLSEDVFTIEGQPNDFVPAAPHEPPNDKDSFDNTFVSLSKAVNLQASYMGYNITSMDPLHLVDTGSGKFIFAMPEGSSTDYHDYNRIFVPNGLFYVPEFSGEYHSHTAEISSVEEFKEEHSKSVGVSLAGELAPAAFNYSRTIQRGRETIAGQDNSVTLGRTRGIFYNLVLDKPRMKLTEDFRSRVVRLLDTHDFKRFLDVFGTHYPVAVMYGGLGVLEVSYSQSTRQRLESSGVNVAAEASVLLSSKSKSRLGVSASSQSSSQQTYQQEIGSQSENFYWVGGTHISGGSQGWGVGTDGVVPIHVSLRPLHELLVPPFFGDPEITDGLRNELAAATDAYLLDAAIDARRSGDKARTISVKFTVDRLFCLNGGKQGNGKEIETDRTDSYLLFRTTQFGFDWASETVQRFNQKVTHRVALREDFTYKCGENGEDILAKAKVPQSEREWIFTYENGAFGEDILEVIPRFSEDMFGGNPSFRLFDEAVKKEEFASLICGGRCDPDRIAGAKVTRSIGIEQLAELQFGRPNDTLCIDVAGNSRRDCAELQLDLTMEVLKW